MTDNNTDSVIAPARGLYYGMFFAMLLNSGAIGLVVGVLHFFH